jgi:hypothetical protein
MFRKMLGTVTAVTAALMLVGVAWAAGDAARDDSSAISVAGSAVTSASTPTTDDTTSATAPDTTGNTTPDDNSSSTSTSPGSSTTDVTVDDSATGTTIDDHGGTTDTTIDDHGGTTGTTVDDDRDDDDEETRSPAPVNSEAKSYVVGDAGSVAIQIVNGQLVLLDVKVNQGWSHEIDKARADEIEVRFESGEGKAEFEAKLRDGQIRIEIERDDD